MKKKERIKKMIALIKMDNPKVGDICFYRCVDDRFIFCKITHYAYIDDKHMYKFINMFTGAEESGTGEFWKVKNVKKEFVDEQQKRVCELQENICRLAYEEEKATRDKLKNLERWAQEKRTNWKRDCVSAMCGNQVTNASFCGFAVAVFDEILVRIKRESYSDDTEEVFSGIKNCADRLDKADIRNLMFADYIKWAEQMINSRIESLFGNDTTKTQHKEQ